MVFCARCSSAWRCGLVNGLLIAYGRIVPFIVTLAMLVSARGLAERISDRRSQLVTDPTHHRHRQHPACSASRCWSTSSPRSSRSSAGWCSTAPRSGGARSPSAATPRRPGWPASTCAATPPRSTCVSGLCCGIAAIMIIVADHDGLQHPRRPLRAGRHRRGHHRRHAAHRRPRHADRLDPRRARVHHDHQPVRAEQPADRGPEHRQGRDHRRRRAAPAARRSDRLP